MEEKMIIVNQVKSNRSEFMVWQVAITGEQFEQYCKSPLKALRFAFMLKKTRGVKIAMESIATLQQAISSQKGAENNQGKSGLVGLEELSGTVRRFKELKVEHPGALLLFREDDFYTAYSEDAESISELLHIVITRKGKRNTASFPARALDTYLPKLVKAGKRIAICDTDNEAAA